MPTSTLSPKTIWMLFFKPVQGSRGPNAKEGTITCRGQKRELKEERYIFVTKPVSNTGF